MRTKLVSIGDNVAVSSTENQDVTVEAPCRVQGKLAVRMYRGPELDLRLTLNVGKIINSVFNVRKPLIDMVGKAYIDGDDDYFEWDIDQEIQAGETIRIAATNANAAFTYDYRVNFTLIFD